MRLKLSLAEAERRANSELYQLRIRRLQIKIVALNSLSDVLTAVYNNCTSELANSMWGRKAA